MKRKNLFKRFGILITALGLSVTAVPAPAYGAKAPAVETEDVLEADALMPVDALTPAAVEGQDTDTENTPQASESEDDEEAGQLKLTLETYERSFQTKDGLVYKTISYQYPVAEGDSPAAKAFNKFYKAQKNKWLKAAKANLEEAKSLVLELEDKNRHYTDDVTCEITSQDGRYISVLQSGYEYMLGAHGWPYRISYILDAQTGKKVTAAQILGLSKKQVNSRVSSLYVQKKKKLAGSEEDMFYATEDIAGLKKTLAEVDFNKNMYYLKNGKLVFYVYPYLVGPYAAGFVEVSIKL